MARGMGWMMALVIASWASAAGAEPKDTIVIDDGQMVVTFADGKLTITRRELRVADVTRWIGRAICSGAESGVRVVTLKTLSTDAGYRARRWIHGLCTAAFARGRTLEEWKRMGHPPGDYGPPEPARPRF